MGIKFKWFVHSHYGWIIMFIFVISIAFIIIFYKPKTDSQILLAGLGVLLSFVYFIQKQQIDEAKLFKDLFVEFNNKYDELNEKLNIIIEETDVLKELCRCEKDTLYEYFNLCAEEFLFYQKGYIYPEVWIFWVEGMKIYFSNKRVHDLWAQEDKTLSYYGLNIQKELDRLPRYNARIVKKTGTPAA